MEFTPRAKIFLAFILFITIYYALVDFIFKIEFLIDFGVRHSLILAQVIYGLFSCFFIIVLPGKVAEYGFKVTNLPYKRISLIIFALQLLPLISIFILIFDRSVELYSWMHLSLGELIFSYLILSPIAEEIFLRGLILTLLAPLQIYKIRVVSLTLSAPVIISSLLFGLMHVDFFMYGVQPVNAIKTITSITLLGVVCGYYTEKHGGLLPAIFAHALFNFFGIILFKIGLMFLY